MLEENALGISVLLVYIVIFAVALLIAMIPVVINAIGLARICNKLGAFAPVWCWVWALLCPPIAILRAGDWAAMRQSPFPTRSHFQTGITSVIATTVLAVLSYLLIAMAGLTAESGLGAFSVVLIIVVILLCIALFAIAIWMTVLLYISYFRIFKLYVPTWGAWLMLAGMVLLSQFSFLLLPVLSFLPMREGID